MAIDKVTSRLDSLISMGEKVLSTRRSPSQSGGIIVINSGDYVDYALFRQWRTSSLAFLNTLPGEYVYHKEFETHCKSGYFLDAQQGIAILRAAKEDIEGGYLQKVETLVSANVFSDFLEMAEYVLEKEYKDPAASLTGAVSEDGLRRICANNGITLKTKEDVSSLNQKLVQKQIYNPLQQKQIQVWNEIRNNADHGKFDQYNAGHVKDMLSGVQKFLCDYLV